MNLKFELLSCYSVFFLAIFALFFSIRAKTLIFEKNCKTHQEKLPEPQGDKPKVQVVKKITTGIIRLYQLTVSPFLGKNCRFSPSCSDYAIEAIEKRGFFLGSWLTIKRLLRCNPWNKQFGEDQVP